MKLKDVMHDSMISNDEERGVLLLKEGFSTLYKLRSTFEEFVRTASKINDQKHKKHE